MSEINLDDDDDDDDLRVQHSQRACTRFVQDSYSLYKPVS